MTFAETIQDGVKVSPLMPGSRGRKACAGESRYAHWPKVISSSFSSLRSEYVAARPMAAAAKSDLHLGTFL